MPYATAPKERRPAAIAAAVVVQGVLGWLVVQGLAGRFPPEPPADDLALVTVDVTKPKPPPPPPHPEPRQRRAGEGAPPAIKSRSEAPPPEPRVVVRQPDPIAPSTESANEAPPGSSQVVGNGSGAGGRGNGSGIGSGGNGSGAGAASPARRIAGSLGDRDYPRAAADAGAAGTVAIAFRVRPDGRVDQCRVLASSGYSGLDELTCNLVQRRFRYEPARDAAGAPVATILRTSFTWGTRARG